MIYNRVIVNLFWILMLFLSSCSKDGNNLDESTKVNAQFFGSLSNVSTKALIEIGEEIPNGDKVGIFALSYSGTDESSVEWPAEQGNYQIFNLEGTTAAGTPQTISTTTEYLYPAGQKIAFYSYYPRTATPVFNSGSAPSIDVIIPSTPTAQTDYLWATPVTGTSSLPGINFVYNHVFSLIRIKIQKSTTEGLTIKTVAISTTQKQKGLMNIATGTMTSTDLAGGATEFAISSLNIDIPLQGTGGAPLQLNDGKFLFIPGTTITAIKLFIRVSGEFIDREYTILNPQLTLIKGAAINVVLTVSKKDAVISNWDEIGGDIEIIGEVL